MASAGASRHIELFFKIFQEGVVQAAWSVLGLVGLLGVPACVGSVDGPNGSTAPSQAALDGELATPAVDPTAESGGDRGPAESAPQSGSEAVDADGFNEPSRSAGPVKQEGVGAQGGPGTTGEVIPSEPPPAVLRFPTMRMIPLPDRPKRHRRVRRPDRIWLPATN